MKKYIILFSSGYRPKEDHFEGLLYAIKKDKNYKMVVFIEKNEDTNIINLLKKYGNSNLLVLDNNNILKTFRYCMNATLIFGKPKGLKKYILFFYQLINKKVTRIITPPGIILKATGHFKNKRNFLNFYLYVRNYLINKFFKFIILTPTDQGMLYQAAAFSYPINLVLNYPLPKNIYLSYKIKLSNSKNIILFSPTHRWDGKKSPIELILENEDFVNKIIDMGFLIRYTLHPDQIKNVNLNFSKKVKIFNKNWENVFSLITDYSSLGYDYLYSGGGNLIYYIPDIEEFQEYQGIGPLFKAHVEQNYHYYSAKKIIKHLSSFKTNSKTLKPTQFNFPLENYFSNLQEILKKL